MTDTFRFFVALTFVLFAACARVDSEKEIREIRDPVAFIGGYRSLMSVNEVAEALVISKDEVAKAIQPKGPVPRTSQTLLKYQSFEIERKDVLSGFSGKLSFEFYHDRLGRMIFWPADIDSFVAAAFRKKPNAEGVVETENKSLRIAVGGRHVVWMDSRIMDVVSRLD